MSRRPDIRRLKPFELLRIINSTAVGEALGDRQLRRHRATAGYRIGDADTVDFFRYLAWLYDERHAPAKIESKEDAAAKYREHAATMAERSRLMSKAGRDVGPIPPVKDPARRAACRDDFEKFCLTYFARTFYRPFTKEHRDFIRTFQTILREGGRKALGVYRGWGKSALGKAGALWAVLYGHRKYLPLIGATLKIAKDALNDIKMWLETSELLLEDFPEACVPIRALDGIAARSAGQLVGGKPTHIEWKSDEISLPWIEGAASAGARIVIRGLTGQVRGLVRTLPDGAQVRPDFAYIDDPQTDKSAESPGQCATREKLITRAIMNLGGHDRKMSALMPCTIIQKGDLADRFLDRGQHPEWQGMKIPFFIKWPDRHEDLWMRDYAGIWAENIRDEDGGHAEAERRATEFYRAHRAEMDAGAVVNWPECFEEGEVSAIQHGYNKLLKDGAAAFASEFQLEPLDPFAVSDEPPLEVKNILRKMGGTPRRMLPVGMTTLTAFIDCGKRTHLHWLVTAWGAGASGAIVDAGVAEVKRSQHGLESDLTQALLWTVESIFNGAFRSEDGGEFWPAILLVDSGWQARKVVYPTCKLTPQRGRVFPSKGFGDEQTLYVPKKINRRDFGYGWVHSLTKERDALLVSYQTDTWKTWAEERLRTPLGGSGSLQLWLEADARAHAELAQQFTSERPTWKEKKDGTRFKKWTLLPARANHFWDCLVGCCVGAARVGVKLDLSPAPPSAAALPPPPSLSARRELPARTAQSENVREKVPSHKIRAHY
jgi:hypothetical protein